MHIRRRRCRRRSASTGGSWGGSRKLIVRNIGGIPVTDVRVIHLHKNAAGLGGDLEEAFLQPRRGLIPRSPIDVDVVPPVGHFKRINSQPAEKHLDNEEEHFVHHFAIYCYTFTDAFELVDILPNHGQRATEQSRVLSKTEEGI